MSEYTSIKQRPLHHKLGVGGFLLTLILGGFVLWSAFVKPTNDITVGEGGTAIINQQPDRFFIPFIECGVEQRSGGNMGTYIRAGLRVEF